jgi:hypothetical protein
VSLSASRDEEEAFETERGGALRWVGLIQLIDVVHDLSGAINFLGVY